MRFVLYLSALFAVATGASGTGTEIARSLTERVLEKVGEANGDGMMGEIPSCDQFEENENPDDFECTCTSDHVELSYTCVAQRDMDPQCDELTGTCTALVSYGSVFSLEEGGDITSRICAKLTKTKDPAENVKTKRMSSTEAIEGKTVCTEVVFTGEEQEMQECSVTIDGDDSQCTCEPCEDGFYEFDCGDMLKSDGCSEAFEGMGEPGEEISLPGIFVGEESGSYFGQDCDMVLQEAEDEGLICNCTNTTEEIRWYCETTADKNICGEDIGEPVPEDEMEEDVEEDICPEWMSFGEIRRLDGSEEITAENCERYGTEKAPKGLEGKTVCTTVKFTPPGEDGQGEVIKECASTIDGDGSQCTCKPCPKGQVGFEIDCGPGLKSECTEISEQTPGTPSEWPFFGGNETEFATPDGEPLPGEEEEEEKKEEPDSSASSVPVALPLAASGLGLILMSSLA